MIRLLRRANRHLFGCLVAALLSIFVTAIATTPTEAQTQTTTFTCTGGFTEEVAPPVVMTSLLTVENPVIPKNLVTGAPMLRDDLVDYIASLPAAIRLGKALFWDMQVGSDDKTSCATCHFQAGQDGRTRNQLHPGPNAMWDVPGMAPNAELWPGAYPFTVPDPYRDTDNIVGSQGVRKMAYKGLSRSGVETTAAVADPVFNVAGKNVRQVTGRQAPASVNAVFNARNFHDGRAQPEFNGVNPVGRRDTAARVWYVGLLGPTQIDISIANASLASQSVGPVLNPVEMSAAGRSFPDLGRKLLARKPLGLQKVDPSDSVLGALADTAGNGLRTTYQAMIQAAFKPKWWNTTKSVKVNGAAYSMTEANMSLFWGLSVMLYQATLVADRSPMDQYLASRQFDLVTRALISHNPALLDPVVQRLAAEGITITRDNILNGLRLFEMPPPPAPAPNGAGCSLCHTGAETTSASVRNLVHGVEADDIAFVNAGFDQRMERMFWQIPPVPPGTDTVTLNPLSWTVTAERIAAPAVPPADARLAVYDTGYYNIGVRPTADDLGTDGTDPFGTSWSVVHSLQQRLSDPSYIKVPGGTVNCGLILVRNSTGYPLLSGALRKTERIGVAGSFKTAGLRNIELTGPYFHNGGKSTLRQVVEFYDDGGDFDNPTKAPLIVPLGLTPDEIRDLTAFMVALTDERVRTQKAPFDHPQLFVPNGANPDGTDMMFEVPAVGAAGGWLLQRFLNLNPFGDQ